MNLLEILRKMIELRASDLFLKSGAPLSCRIDGAVRPMPAGNGEESAVVEKEFLESVVQKVLRPALREALDAHGEADAAYEVEGVGRFRLNAFRAQGRIEFVFRHIPRQIPDMVEINLPEKQLKQLAEQPRGLVLVTGTAGSGKSTCLATMVEWINQIQNKHIITIEDPIEFVFEDKRSILSQRELGIDTESFANALKYSMRQSPDVIMIGEMRDRETMEAALNAAETGHLVLSTLHTVNATQTIERIIGYFPPYLHDLIRLQLSLVLQGVVSLRLLRRCDTEGRIPAAEILLSTPTIQELLQEGKTRHLSKALREGAYVSSMEQYQEMYDRSINDPDGFWLEQAESLHWFKKPTRSLVYTWDTKGKTVNHTWFDDGELNVAYNCLDRHLGTPTAKKAALVWQGEPEEDTVTLTYEELHKEVCKFANVLKSLRIKKGDRVCIYMPMILELPIVMLACTRIGAIHSITFGGFSADSLKSRIKDCGAKLLITADGGYRGGRIVPLKENADEALRDCPEVKFSV